MTVLRQIAAVSAIIALIALTNGAFAAGSSLNIRRISPSGENVPLGQQIVFQFDRDMVRLGNMARNDKQVPIKIEPDPGCEWRWLDTSELACRLPEQRRFRPATQYHITVHEGLQALDGARLADTVRATFKTILPQVEWVNFQAWHSPVLPVFLVRFNLPVTAGAVADHLSFESAESRQVPARAEPFTEEREGPVWLTVPGSPGTLIKIDNPTPNTPLDAHKAADKARVQWLVRPARPLAKDVAYELIVSAGLRTPLGSLGGEGGESSGGHFRTFGDFHFKGVACHGGTGSQIVFEPHDRSGGHCRPDSASLVFSAPVPLSTLMATQWSPAPAPQQLIQRQWHGYSPWRLRKPASRYASENDADFPLPFDLKPTTQYRITVPAGVEDSFGRTLAQPVTVAMETGHYQPSITLPPDQAVLEARERTIAPLRFVNLSNLDLDYRRLFAADLGRIVPPLERAPAATTSLLARPGLTPRQDKQITAPLGVRKLLDGRSGVVWGEVGWFPGYDHRTSSRKFMAEVTPWEVFAKVGYFNTLVWVSDFSNGLPIANAHVGFYVGHPDTLDRLLPLSKHFITTNIRGLAVLPGTLAMTADWFKQWETGAKHYYIAVTRRDTLSLLPLDWSFRRYIGESSNYTFYSDNAPLYGHLRAWAVTQQGIYRPGSDVHLALFARDVSNTALVTPPALDYHVTVNDPQNNTVLDKKHVRLDSFGGYSTTLDIPETAPMGWYTIHLAWPTGTDDDTTYRQIGRFLVTEFVPASFKVTATIEGKHFEPGTTVKSRTRARLHAGGPYTDAEVKFVSRLVARPFRPDNPLAAGFAFDANPDNAPENKTIGSKKATLDKHGEAATQFTVPDHTGILYGALKLETAVKSARATWVADRASASFSARNRFVGLNIDAWLLTADKPFKVHYLVVDPAGRPAAGAPVHIALKRKVVSNARVKNAAGHFTTRENVTWEKEETCRAMSGNAPASCTFTPKHAGIYRIVAEVTDKQGRVQTTTLRTWAIGSGLVLWSQEKRVTLVPDKSHYKPGETAHVLVQNPFPGALALVTVERYGILWKKIVPLAGSTPVLDIPVKQDFFPGAYLSVAIFSPRVYQPGSPDLGRPELALGSIALPITGTGGSLHLEVTPVQSTYKPRDTVHVKVHVADKAGKPSPKTRLVAVVIDQGVLDLIADGTDYYDPRKSFYAPPGGPDMVNFSLAEQLLTELQPKAGKGENPGGGGSGGPAIRSIFKYSTYWNAGLETDRAGNASFAFNLPDNLTRWRILVMALTPGDAMGLGTSGVRVNLPIQLHPALPNQVHAGDHFAAGFEVTNRTQNRRTIHTTIAAEGTPVTAPSRASHKLALGSYEHDIAWLKLAAKKPGEIKLTATAASATLGDAMVARIPVRRADTPITAAEYGSINGNNKQVPIKVPAGAIPGATRLSVTLAPTLIGGLGNAFRALRDDPLQSWETRLSRAVLASDYLKIQSALGHAVKWPNAADTIRGTLQKAADFQAPNGGMSFWVPRNEFVSPWLSIYTSLAFNWLDRAGRPIPEQVQKPLNDYLRGAILDDAETAPVLRAAALAALAPSNSLQSGAVADMVPELNRLRLFGQALLLEAAVRTGDSASAETIAQSLFSHAEESAGQISFNEKHFGAYLDILATPIRANCTILDSLADYAATQQGRRLVGDTPAKLMRWIIAARAQSGAWPNSQENVFCTTATIHYAELYEKPIHNLMATVSAGGQTFDKVDFASRRAPAQNIDTPLPATTASEPFSLSIATNSTGRLYYNVNLTYALSPEAVTSADAGFTLRRTYRVKRGNEWLKVNGNTTIERGDIVRVDLYVDVPTTRHHVVLTDPLPGCFEAVNRHLATTMRTPADTQPNSTILWFNHGAWPNGSITTNGFYHRETGFDAVRFFAGSLEAGHYHLVYTAQVISPGNFIAPAPRVKEIYQPDIFGRGSSRHIKASVPEE